MLEVPGTRYCLSVELDQATGRHRSAILDGTSGTAPVVEDLDAADLLELIVALKAAEKAVWRADLSLPAQHVVQRRPKGGAVHAHLA